MSDFTALATSAGKPKPSKIGVAIGPGLMALTRTPRPISSRASDCTSERSAALLAAYRLKLGEPSWLAIEVVTITEAVAPNSGRAF